MSNGWKRVHECSLCGSPRCVISTVNPSAAYCFRFAKRFFIYKNGDVSGNKSNSSQGKHQQTTFSFADDFDNHFDALSE